MEHIARYLRDIYFEKKRGQLVFRRDKAQKYLFFQEGKLVFAKTNQENELLGEILFKLGKLSQEAYDNIEEYIEPMEIIGQVLLKRGLLSKQDLVDGLSYQMREIILNTFPLFDGNFRFQEREDLTLEDIDIKISIPVLIADGIRRMKFDTNLKKFMKDRTISPKERGLVLQLTEVEKGILNYVKVNSFPPDILKKSGSNPEDFWKSMYLFYCLDLIDLGEEATVLDKAEGPTAKSGDRDTQRRIEEVEEFSQRVHGMNHYQILDVAKSAPLNDIKKAYFGLARQYHPDLFDRETLAAKKEIIDDVFDKITKAYHTLSDEGAREAYDKQLAEEDIGDKRGVAKEAEKKFRQAKTLYNMGRNEEAIAYLEEAIRLDPHKASFFLLMAMIEGKIPSYHKKAEGHFREAIKLEPWSPDGYLGMGILYKNADLKIKAVNQFKKALQVDPGNEAAIRELKSAEGKGSKPGLKDLLSGDTKGFKDLLKSEIFGKKKKK
ncbi:DnaJ domain-containing protein [Acidobacteriota bacterium]